MPGYKLMLKFDTDEPEFMRGFEAGRLWMLISRVADHELMSEELEGTLFHAVNAEMVLRMLEAADLRGWRAEFCADPEWMVLTH